MGRADRNLLYDPRVRRLGSPHRGAGPLERGRGTGQAASRGPRRGPRLAFAIVRPTTKRRASNGPAIESAPMGQLESFNPATGELIGSVETIKPGQVQSIVDDVAEVQ